MRKIDHPITINDRQQRVGLWSAGIFTAVIAAIFGAIIYAVFVGQKGKFGQEDAILLPTTALLFCASLLSFFLIRRGKYKLGTEILFITNMLLPIIGTLLLDNMFWVSAAYILIFAPIMYNSILLRSSRRLATTAIAIVALLMIGIEIWNPGFRGSAEFVGNIIWVIVFLAAAVMLIFLVRQAWAGNLRLKLVTSFTILALVSVGIVGTVAYLSYRNQVRDDIRQRLVSMITIVALQQDAELHASIQNADDEGTEAFKQIRAINSAIVAANPDITSMYTMRMNSEGAVYFVVDSVQPGDEENLAGLSEIYDEPTPEMMIAFTNDQPLAEKDFYTDKWGTTLSAYAPFFAEDGRREGIIGIDISADTVLDRETDVLHLIVGTAVAALIAVILIGLFLGNLYTRPITNLAATAQKIADGNLSVRAEIETTDEVGDLVLVFNSMTSRLQATLEGLEQRIAERTRALETSTEVSRRLSTILDQRDLVREVVEQVRESFDYYHAHIYLFDEKKENLMMVGGTGRAGQTMLEQGHSVTRGEGLVGRAGDTNLPVFVSDVSQTESWLPNPLLPETKAEAAIPISIGDNVIGVLDVQDDEIGGLTETDIELLQSIANQVAIALQNAQAYQQTQQQIAQEALMANINQQIQSTTDVEDALQVAVREIGRALGTDTSIRLIAKTNGDK